MPFLKTLILTISLLTCLAACHPRDDADAPKLVLLTTGGAVRQAVNEAVAGFERENPGVRVQVVTTPGKDYYVKSLTMLAGRAHVDVLWMGQGFGIFAGRGALLDLQPFAAKDLDIESYNRQVIDWYRHGDKLYGLPYGIDVVAIAYNKDLFDAAGIPYPSPDWHVRDMIDIAGKLTQRHPGTGRTKIAGLGIIDLDYRYYGLSLLSTDWKRFALNTETGRKWLRHNVDLIHKDRILQRGSDMESIDRLTGFLNQQVAMIACATWDLQEVRNRAPFGWDTVAIPVGEGGRRTGWASSSGFCMAQNTKHPELAWKLLKKLTNAEFQKKVLANTIPAIHSLHEEYLKNNPALPENLSELLKMINHMQPDSRIAAFQEVDAEWNYWRDQALLRKITVEEALENAESNINRILDLHNSEVAP